MQPQVSGNGEVLCGANLRSAGQNARLRMGVVMLAVSLVLSIVLVRAEVPRVWRLALFIPFFMAAVGAWQGLYRTCPKMVRDGTKESEQGDARVVDPEQMRGARKLAFRVLVGSMCTALLTTALVMAVP